MTIKEEILLYLTTLESIIDGVLDEFLICKKPEAMGVSEARGCRGARGLKKYLQGPNIRVYETDRTEGDITAHRTDRTEGDSTMGEERKKSFWSKKKYWILAISVISLLTTLTLGFSLYLGLYSEKHDSKGNFVHDTTTTVAGKEEREGVKYLRTPIL